MKRPYPKLQKQKKESKITHVGLNNKEEEFNQFIRSMINNREVAEAYIQAAISEGQTRKQAIYELNSMGVFLRNLK